MKFDLTLSYNHWSCTNVDSYIIVNIASERSCLSLHYLPDMNENTPLEKDGDWYDKHNWNKTFTRP